MSRSNFKKWRDERDNRVIDALEWYPELGQSKQRMSRENLAKLKMFLDTHPDVHAPSVAELLHPLAGMDCSTFVMKQYLDGLGLEKSKREEAETMTREIVMAVQSGLSRRIAVAMDVTFWLSARKEVSWDERSKYLEALLVMARWIFKSKGGSPRDWMVDVVKGTGRGEDAVRDYKSVHPEPSFIDSAVACLRKGYAETASSG